MRGSFFFMYSVITLFLVDAGGRGKGGVIERECNNQSNKST